MAKALNNTGSAGCRLSRREFLGGALSTVALAGLSACSGNASSVSEGSSDAAAASVARIGITAPAGIEPATAADASGMQVCCQLFDTLTRYDYEARSLACLAAESYEASDDAMRFTFKLAEASFHNGEAVTALSFKRAWERLVSLSVEEGASSGAYAFLLSCVVGYDDMLAGKSTGLSGVVCPDDTTLEVTLSLSYADFPRVCAHPALAPVPQAAVEDPKGFSQLPVGNGPFKLDEAWKAGEDIALSRFDAYADGAATVDGLEFVLQEDTDAAYKAFRSEELDVCEIPASQLSAARSDYGLSEDGLNVVEREHLVVSNDPSLLYLACNISSGALSASDVRKAISMAIDREAICSDLYNGMRLPADDVIPPVIPGYRDGAWDCCTYDADAAKERIMALIAPAQAPAETGEAGADSGSSEETDAEDAAPSILPGTDEEVEPLQFSLIYRSAGGMKALAEELTAQLEKVNVEFDAEGLDRDEYEQRLAAGSFDLALCTWTADILAMDAVLYPLFHSANVGGRNISGYSEESVDAKIGEARAMNDTLQRIARLQEADDIIAVSAPVIPVAFYTHATAVSDRIDALTVSPDRRNRYASCSVA